MHAATVPAKSEPKYVPTPGYNNVPIYAPTDCADALIMAFCNRRKICFCISRSLSLSSKAVKAHRPMSFKTIAVSQRRAPPTLPYIACSADFSKILFVGYPKKPYTAFATFSAVVIFTERDPTAPRGATTKTLTIACLLTKLEPLLGGRYRIKFLRFSSSRIPDSPIIFNKSSRQCLALSPSIPKSCQNFLIVLQRRRKWWQSTSS
mmetsp:Transcript_17862/g.23537  ORF Transcript_17862/g.23537 Transcript_17862/m.23537 type:complete len:206 (-) Transcript_17862:799-1416(-)